MKKKKCWDELNTIIAMNQDDGKNEHEDKEDICNILCMCLVIAFMYVICWTKFNNLITKVFEGKKKRLTIFKICLL